MDLPSVQPLIDYISQVDYDLAVGAGSSAVIWAITAELLLQCAALNRMIQVAKPDTIWVED